MEVEPLSFAPVEAVFDLLAREVKPGRRVQRAVGDCVGCVLAADLRAGFDYPPYDRAVMDGYAVRSADFGSTPAEFRCDGLVRAGHPEGTAVEKGGCVQINTGAAIPNGADAVVMVERSRVLENGRVLLDDQPAVGQSIERRGEILKQGDLVVRSGVRISAGAAAAITAAGFSEVTVFEPVRVAIISTGDEIVAAGESLSRGQIYDSNSIAVQALIRQAGGVPVPLGRCPDDPVELRSFLARGLEHDVLCVTGGMSKGSHDFVPSLLEELGIRWLVTSLNLKPGKPTRIGRFKNKTWVLGLPGNPVSCAVCFILFGRAILDGLHGLSVAMPPHLNAEVSADMPRNAARPLYQPAEWKHVGGGRSVVSPIMWRGSGDPFGFASANALILRPAHAEACLRGETVPFVPLDVPQ